MALPCASCKLPTLDVACCAAVICARGSSGTALCRLYCLNCCINSRSRLPAVTASTACGVGSCMWHSLLSNHASAWVLFHTCCCSLYNATNRNTCDTFFVWLLYSCSAAAHVEHHMLQRSLTSNRLYVLLRTLQTSSIGLLPVGVPKPTVGRAYLGHGCVVTSSNSRVVTLVLLLFAHLVCIFTTPPFAICTAAFLNCCIRA